jgi:hypothetical protein
MNTKQNCASCKFFISGGLLGECHRYPQAVNKHDNNWCGEYIPFPIPEDDLIYVNDEIKNVFDNIVLTNAEALGHINVNTLSIRKRGRPAKGTK